VIEELTQIQIRFLRGGGLEGRRINWVSCDKVCLSKEEGGLGVKDLHLFNLFLLSKWVWRCLSDDNVIWLKLIKFRYGSISDKLLNTEGGSGSRMDSIWWRDLCSVGKEKGVESNWLTTSISRRIGNGEKTSFWKEVWVGEHSLCHEFLEL